MNFGFFESMNQAQAKEYLDRFRESETEAVTELLQAAVADNVRADYSLDSLTDLLWWLSGRLGTIRRAEDPAVPDWIRRTPSYVKGLFDFDAASQVSLLRAAHYLGECFIRAGSGRLRWETGDPDFAQKNMPVVAGFRDSAELPVLLVTENLIRRVLADGASRDAIERMVASWKRRLPDAVTDASGAGAAEGQS